MTKPEKRRSRKIGLPPGSLIHIGEPRTTKAKVTAFAYDENTVLEKQELTAAEALALRREKKVTWIDVDSVHNVALLDELGTGFGINPLVLEDILNTDQRPKMDDFGDHIYLVFKMLSFESKNDELISEQVSLILGDNFVLSFQEIEGDVFEPIRDRIRTGKGKIRREGPDFLAYSLLDAVVDNYFLILEKEGEKIQALEETVTASPTRETLRQIYQLKRELLYLRRSVWPLRDVINSLLRDESSLLRKETIPYLKDVYDHTVHTIDTVETYREMISGMLEIYLSTTSNRLSEIMKVLTIITSIFIPLSFIAGIYGMNFEYIPETRWQWGYFITLGVMFVIGLVMLIMFRRKKWI